LIAANLAWDNDAPPDALSQDLEDELVDGDGGGEDDDGVALAAAAQEPPVTVALTMLRAAVRVVEDYARSSCADPLLLPAQLTRTDRAAIHHLAASLSLAHCSEGEGYTRRLVISREPGATAAAGGSAANAWEQECNPAWAQLRVKYDVRHW
jgi:R3H domain